MKNRHLVTILLLMMTFALFGFGCKTIESRSNNPSTSPVISPTPAETATKITKDILKKRLGGKDVQFVEKFDEEKPNPLLLILKIVEGGSSPKFTLNNENYELKELMTKLRAVFRERENNGVFLVKTNEVDKRLNLAASQTDIDFYNKKGISVEDFEKLVNDLHDQDIKQLYVNFAELPVLEIDVEPPPPPKKGNVS